MRRRRIRRGTRRTIRRRRIFRPVPMRLRRPVIRRPLGSMIILGATAGVAYKLGKQDAQKIQEYAGYPPDQLSEEDLKAAMTDLNIKSEPLDDEDRQEIKQAQTSSKASTSQPTESQGDYIEELQKLAGLRDLGIITEEEFEIKKQKLLGM